MTEENKVKLENNVITLLTPDRRSFELEPAYRVVGTADRGPDPHGLVGKIQYEKDLKAMNADIYLDSLILADTAYQVERGFIGEKKELMESLSDGELLDRYLLDTLL